MCLVILLLIRVFMNWTSYDVGYGLRLAYFVFIHIALPSCQLLAPALMVND